ncbi:hypothetical protein Tco_1433306, partial [Tanacetum coccineum]
MSLDKTEPEVIPLWNKLCNIPLEAWTTNGISALASRIEVVYKNGAKEVICRKNVKVVYDWKLPCCNSYCVFGHFSHQCGKNTDDKRKGTSVKEAGEEIRIDNVPKQNASKGVIDNEWFTTVRHKKRIGWNDKVLRPNFKPNTQQSRFQPRKPKARAKKVSDNETPKSISPQKKAWSVHGEILSAMKRSAN